MKTLVIATHNQGKLREFRTLFADDAFDVRAASDFSLPEPAETEQSFEGNAAIKARFVAQRTGFVALADDSGLEVRALDGAPGVHTADWAQTDQGRDFYLAMDKVRLALEARVAQPPFAANFTCVLALAWPSGRIEFFRGEVHGHVAFPPRGKQGFGFDPVFIPDGYEQSFAELDPMVKQGISHRARAFEKLRSCGILEEI